jgi:hypothetical protein
LGSLTSLRAQDSLSVRQKQIMLNSDTIKLDSLTLIPGSVQIKLDNGRLLDSSQFRVDELKSIIILKPGVAEQGQNISVQYRSFPFDLSKPIAHKSLDELLKAREKEDAPPLIYPRTTAPRQDDLFGLSDFNKSGSISRAISVGNSQDLSVASNLNLQIAGNITPELQLKASITDNNIPIQPDGNTQQIQDFDQVFIQLSHKNGDLIAGDFVLHRPKSYFLAYNKKAQGAYADVHFPLSKKKDAPSMRTYGGIAVSRGKFARNQIMGIEGSQGPYKLHGANFERYIVVLSGTERVYIDGKLLTRGQNYDYIIDYNTAEITFMPRVLITKDKRINVEFQYSDRNYASYLLNAGLEYKSKKLQLATHYYKESDLKDQPLDQELTDAQKQLLYNIGDSLFLAISPKADSVAFNGNEVLYKKIDSLGYSPVYVYSTNPDSAHYRLGFTMVGAGNGDYVQIKSAANGRVFKWVAPVNGVRQGDYEPVVLLVTPKKRQMVVMEAAYEVLKNTHIKAELALSNKDLNLMSPYDDADNQGVAYKVGLDNSIKLNKTKKEAWRLKTAVNYEFIDKNFSTIERFRPVEFNRDWNISTYDFKEQHLFDATIGLEQKRRGFVRYQFKNYSMQDDYRGIRNRLIGNLNMNHQWHLDFDGSLTQTDNKIVKTDFLRHRMNISKGWKNIRIGMNELAENNRIKDTPTDSLTASSYAFQEFTAYVENGDTARNKFRLHYKWREDKVSSRNNLYRAMLANEAGLTAALLKSKSNKLRLTFSYRKLEITDSNLTRVRPDETGLGQIDHNLRLWKGALIANTFYQIGSVMEVEKEFSYVEVSPGQGVYSWTDYNGNGVKELDEFEIAAFADQADYIRVYIPGTNYIKTFGNQFSTSIMLNFGRLWRRSKNKFLRGLSHFSNQLVYRSQHKTQSNDVWEIANPFYTDIFNPKVLSANNSFRNTFYFNRTHPKYGADLSYRSNQMKLLMTNGFESKEMSEWQLRLRWNMNRRWQINLRMNEGDKESNSEFFNSRDYRIAYYNIEPSLVFQPNKQMRVSATYAYGSKDNQIGLMENVISQTTRLDAKYHLLKRGMLSGMVQYISLNYNGNQNSPVAFEMMQGLRSGDNFTWNIAYQRTILKNLQLSINYNGRKPADTDVIHVGSVQLRAFF